jgi:ribonuclease HI
MPNQTKVNIYTDGACRGNPGPGGYGVVLESPGYPPKELSAGFQKTTNNRMELLAVIVALQSLKRTDVDVTVYSDSKYVVDSITKGWVFGWQKKNFKDKKNPDLWREFLLVYTKTKPKFVWIKGHNEHPQNERCDRLAVAAAQKKELLVDEGFEKDTQNEGLF